MAKKPSNKKLEKQAEKFMKNTSEKVENASEQVESSLDAFIVRLEKLFKDLPHLSESIKHWFGQYIWIFTLIIGLITTIAGVGNLISIDQRLNPAAYIGNTTEWNGWLGEIAQKVSQIHYTPIQKNALVISYINEFVCGILLLFAAFSLKEKKQFGWKLIFWQILLATGLTVLSTLLYHPFMTAILYGCINCLIGVLWLWFAFEIKKEFSKR